jgi:hypothetical protein
MTVVVKVELHKGGIGGEVVDLATMHIINDGTGSTTRGNYNVRIIRKDKLISPKTGRVENYPRVSLHVFNLVARALAACGYK